MKMSEGVEWALHCAVVLGTLPENAALPGKALAEFHGVSESYLLKHLKSLTAAGILESLPGPRGGYRLARPANQVTVLEVVDAVEGKGPAFRCSEIRARGPFPAPKELCSRKACAINAVMLRAERAWRDILRGETLYDIAVQVGLDVEPERLAKAVNWLGERARA